MSDNVIEIKKIIGLKSQHEAWLMSIAGYVDYALSAIDAGCEDTGIEIIRLMRKHLPDPTPQDIEAAHDAYGASFEGDEW